MLKRIYNIFRKKPKFIHIKYKDVYYLIVISKILGISTFEKHVRIIYEKEDFHFKFDNENDRKDFYNLVYDILYKYYNK